MEMVKLKYISDEKNPWFKKGNIYEGYRAKDDKKGLFWCFHIDNDDDPGDYGFPSYLFEVAPDDEEISE